MRQEPAPAEEKLWWCLRDRRLNGFKFRRQVGMGRYIADFYCAVCKLVVELDGDSHDGRQEYDEQRTEELGRRGLKVLRFVNTDVYEHLVPVLEAILKECEARSAKELRSGPSPPTSPRSTGERG